MSQTKKLKKIGGENIEINNIVDYLGNPQNKANCVLIGGLYYKKGDVSVKNSGAVYEIDGTKYRINNGKIIWNESKGRYVTKESLNGHTGLGIVDAAGEVYFIEMKDAYKKDELYIQLSTSACTHLEISLGSVYYTEYNNMAKLKLAYNFTTGMADEINYVRSNGYDRPQQLRGKPSYNTLSNEIYNSAEYNTNHLKEEFSNLHKANIKTHTLDKFFPFSYGLEIETDYGFLPENCYYKNYCIPLKDGSINGTEITTLKFNNVNVNSVINYTRRLMEDCAKFTRCSSNNSLHVNIGDLPAELNNQEFRVAIFNLYRRLQDEIERFIPNYKRDIQYLAGKRGGPKDHCKMLPDIGFPIYYKGATSDYNAWLENCDKLLFQFLNNGHPETSSFNRKNRTHKAFDQPKWEHYNRYYTLNMEPLYFGSLEGARVEYRVHSGTVSPIKTMMWLFITNAITLYALSNAKQILTSNSKLNLEDILQNIYGPNITNEIINYIAKRSAENLQKLFRHDFSTNAEFENDHVYGQREGILLNKLIAD